MSIERPVKTKTVAARLTPRQYEKLEILAIANETTLSGVVSALVDKITLDTALVRELQGVQQNERVLA